uniref:Uncharacterized protein n=1 Tax=Yersinia pestis Java 9 TaxID=880632 RepID=E8PSH4_YERPE|nr:hypothetical protein YPJ_pJARS3650 [Yersinia pestis Java 9]
MPVPAIPNARTCYPECPYLLSRMPVPAIPNARTCYPECP